MQCVENCNDPDSTKHILYEQPVWQTLQMFGMSLESSNLNAFSDSYTPTELVGEMLCQSQPFFLDVFLPMCWVFSLLFRFPARYIHVA